MSDFLRSEVVESIANTGVAHGFAVFTDISVSWNTLRTSDARVDVGWFDPDEEPFVVAWVIRDAASDPKKALQSRAASTDLLNGCPAALKIEIASADHQVSKPQHGIVRVLAREVARPTHQLNRIAALAATACAVTPNALMRFFDVHLPNALPVIFRNMRPFSFGTSWIYGLSTHPEVISRRWISREHRFMEATNVPDDFYAAGLVSTMAEECMFVMWGGAKRFWFRHSYLSFMDAEASMKRVQTTFSAELQRWAGVASEIVRGSVRVAKRPREGAAV
ncbi:MAG TPA: hypothetical protein VMJ10_06185 [Kofleriaceae bacterium]|nr:hypothetical protein [Kofleriaceae bacterium]